jgi:hypothetical protein
MHVKWEYLVEGLPIRQGQAIGIVRTNAVGPMNHIQDHLNLRGEEGWELVQFASTSGASPGCDIYAPGVNFVFKRLKL